MHFGKWLDMEKTGMVFEWAPPHEDDSPTSLLGIAQAERRAVEIARDAGPHIIVEMLRRGLLKQGDDPVAAVMEMMRR